MYSPASEMKMPNENILSNCTPNKVALEQENVKCKKEEALEHCCSECSFKSNNKTAYDRHVNSHTRESDKQGMPDVACLIQQKEFGNCPLSKQKYSCSHCDFSTNVESTFSSHLCRQFPRVKVVPLKDSNTFHRIKCPESANTDVKVVADGGNFKCSKCRFEAKSKGALRLHCLVHDQQPLRCSSCDYVTHFQTLLKLHEKSHSVVNEDECPQLQCPECSYVSIRMCSLERHLLQHSKTKMFQCSKCSFKTLTEDVFKEHEASHVSKRPPRFTCALCNFTAHFPVKYEEHIVTHDPLNEELQAYVESRKFRCIKCPFGTDRQQTLERHIMKHVKKNDTSRGQSSSTSLSPKPKGSFVRKPNMMWPTKEKKELFWCYTLARMSNNRSELVKRLIEMVLSRGKLNTAKIKKMSKNNIYTMINNIKSGRTSISFKEISEIEGDVKCYVKAKGFPVHWKAQIDTRKKLSRKKDNERRKSSV